MLRVPLEKNNNNLISLFAGFCFFLATVELMLPKPVPFFRIGLAHLPILMGINVFSLPSFLTLITVKVLGQALITGTIFSYIALFSVVSSFSAGLVMYSMRNISKKAISFIGISVTGAVVSNTIQIILAIFIMFGKSALYAMPPMFVFGLLMSILLGIFANKFTRDSIWYQKITNDSFEFKVSQNQITEINKKENYFRVGSGILLFALLFFVKFLPIKTLILGVALILCVSDKQKINFVSLLVIFLVIVAFNLYPPSGKIIFCIGNLTVTNEALLRGIEKAVILQSMIYISKWTLKAKINFKSKIGLSVKSAQEVFYKLTTVKNEIEIKNLIPSLDTILLSINKF